MTTAGDVPYVAEWYLRFAEGEAHGRSPIYEGWARGVAADRSVLELIAALPRAKRQPALLFAVSRLLGAPEGTYAEWATWLHGNWANLAVEVSQRLTQANEAGRCAALLPMLAALRGPIALLEVGASAGLCLYPDRYSYRYDGLDRLDPIDGPSTVLLECRTTGDAPIPDRLPEVVWRAGVDLAPLDVNDSDDMRWLQTLAPPEEQSRRDRIRAAAAIVRADPPLLVTGDALDALPALAAEAPAGATLVILHAGLLVYMGAPDRQRFVDTVRSLDATWLSYEAQGVVPGVRTVDGAGFGLARDGEIVALADPHGMSIDWL
jgi:hypothetical protein